MTGYEYVSMDRTRKIYIPALLEKKFKGKKFIVIPMPDGDMIFHPIQKSKDPLSHFQEVMGPVKKSLKETKREILETAMEGV